MERDACAAICDHDLRHAVEVAGVVVEIADEHDCRSPQPALPDLGQRPFEARRDPGAGAERCRSTGSAGVPATPRRPAGERGRTARTGEALVPAFPVGAPGRRCPRRGRARSGRSSPRAGRASRRSGRTSPTRCWRRRRGRRSPTCRGERTPAARGRAASPRGRERPRQARRAPVRRAARSVSGARGRGAPPRRRAEVRSTSPGLRLGPIGELPGRAAVRLGRDQATRSAPAASAGTRVRATRPRSPAARRRSAVERPVDSRSRRTARSNSSPSVGGSRLAGGARSRRARRRRGGVLRLPPRPRRQPPGLAAKGRVRQLGLPAVRRHPGGHRGGGDARDDGDARRGGRFRSTRPDDRGARQDDAARGGAGTQASPRQAIVWVKLTSSPPARDGPERSTRRRPWARRSVPAPPSPRRRRSPRPCTSPGRRPTRGWDRRVW